MRGALTALVVLCGCAGVVSTAEPAPFKVLPGPSAMSAEEKEMAPDAAAGTQQGVILFVKAGSPAS